MVCQTETTQSDIHPPCDRQTRAGGVFSLHQACLAYGSRIPVEQADAEGIAHGIHLELRKIEVGAWESVVLMLRQFSGTIRDIKAECLKLKIDPSHVMRFLNRLAQKLNAASPTLDDVFSSEVESDRSRVFRRFRKGTF